jgi:hypothetical protein
MFLRGRQDLLVGFLEQVSLESCQQGDLEPSCDARAAAAYTFPRLCNRTAFPAKGPFPNQHWRYTAT